MNNRELDFAIVLEYINRSYGPHPSIALEAWTRLKAGECAQPTEQFLADVRGVVAYHFTGDAEQRPDETVWTRLDIVLFDDEGHDRERPDYAAPNRPRYWSGRDS